MSEQQWSGRSPASDLPSVNEGRVDSVNLSDREWAKLSLFRVNDEVTKLEDREFIVTHW